MEGFGGVTAIDTSSGAVTVSVVVPCTAPEVAVIVVLPKASPLAIPPALIVATPGIDDIHVAEAVKS
jgi:hypothetical protein